MGYLVLIVSFYPLSLCVVHQMMRITDESIMKMKQCSNLSHEKPAQCPPNKQSMSFIMSPEGARSQHEPTSYVRGPIQSGRAEFCWWPHGKSWPGFSVWRRRRDARPGRRDRDVASSLCWSISAVLSVRVEMLEAQTHTTTCCQVT